MRLKLKEGILCSPLSVHGADKLWFNIGSDYSVPIVTNFYYYIICILSVLSVQLLFSTAAMGRAGLGEMGNDNSLWICRPYAFFWCQNGVSGELSLVKGRLVDWMWRSENFRAQPYETVLENMSEFNLYKNFLIAKTFDKPRQICIVDISNEVSPVEHFVSEIGALKYLKNKGIVIDSIEYKNVYKWKDITYRYTVEEYLYWGGLYALISVIILLVLFNIRRSRLAKNKAAHS